VADPDLEERASAAPRRPGASTLARALDLGERAFCVLLFAALVVRLAPTLAARPWNAVILLSEGLVVLFMVLRRRPQSVSMRPFDWLAAFVGTAAPLLVRSGGQALAPPQIGAFLTLFGLVFSIWAKLTLRRSFGLAAANRGVVAAGPYALVRHPMYAGYFLIYAGFFLLNPLPWNAGVYLLAVGMQVYRVLAEEKLLAADPGYLAFMGRVRYRLAPGLF
jgi:protein-S-isoprenylcysteine O-methyltransferase Ste14